MHAEVTPKMEYPSCVALRRGLPFGVVMATAGASVLAERCGLHALVAPLLALAVAQSLWTPLAGARRHRAEFALGWRAWWAIGPAHEHTGVHTVPLGLAVIVGGLAARGATSWAWPLAEVSLALTWLLTLLCGSRCAWSLRLHGLPLRTFDGTWFLVPAAFLGAAIAADAVAGRVAGTSAIAIAWLALAGALFGWLSYWAITLVALMRVRRFGLGGVPQAPWWIAMGCAGLAAAALGNVVQGPGSGGWLHALLVDAMVATEVFAVILCVPVLFYSARFLLCHCRFRALAVWPPTFSTAVFALGALATGSVLHSPPFRILGLGAGYATVTFWAVTMAWNVERKGRALWRKRSRQQA